MWVDFAIFLAACLTAGATGGLFPPGEWYDALNKPRWTPPGWVFPVTWMTLYVLMAFAGATLAQLNGAGTALALWSLQIALNALWTPVFFGLKRVKLALGVIAALWVSVGLCVVVFWSNSMIAGLAFLPYFIWVSIASALNYSVWRLNSDLE